MNILFTYNPTAGKAKIKSNLHEIIDIFVNAGHNVMVHPTQQAGDALEVVKNKPEKFFDMVVCSGGDGTLDEVVTGMMQSKEKLPIGYIPAGSTNDFAGSLGISNNMIEAAKDIVNGKEFPCDVGTLNGDPFIYIAAFGLFTEVSYATDQQLKNYLGHLAYILEGIKSLSSVQSYKMKVTYDDETVEGDFIYGMITNSLSVGGFKNITGNDVELDDGKFEVILVQRPTSLVQLNEITMALLNRTFDAPGLNYFKTSHLEIESEEEMSWTVDGEFGGNHKTVNIENKQKALSIMVNWDKEDREEKLPEEK